MRRCYQFYGFNVCSDIELPELGLPKEVGSTDVSIHSGTVPSEGLSGELSDDQFFQANSDHVWLNIPGVARFQISGGRDITYEPAEGADEDSIRLFLLGSGVGALLFQRDFLVLHGNAFEVNGSCVICVGDSGAGKSTLAAEMVRRGHRVVADDVCPIDESGRVFPGMPRIKLWKDTAEKFGIDTQALKRIRPGLEKFNYPLKTGYCDVPLPVSAVYVLNKNTDDEFLMDRITGMEKLEPLKRNTYRHEYLKEMCLEREHFRKCGELANKIQLTNLYRPVNGFHLKELAEFILNDIEN